MDGADFLHLAVRLSGGATEAEWRSAVSRAYYGAFHLARGVVESCGVMLPKTADAHDKVQWCLHHADNSELSVIAETLNSLRATRNLADYDLGTRQFAKREGVLVALGRAQRIVDGLAKVTSEPSFSDVRVAIRNYASNTLRMPVFDKG